MILRKIKQLAVKWATLTAALVVLTGISVPASAIAVSKGPNMVFFGAATQSTTDACNALNTLDSSQGCASTGGGGASSVSGIIHNIVKLLSYIVGVVSVIMLIVGGFKYTTSGGSAENVSSAKNTIVYALIGVAVATLAQILILFVFTVAKKA